MEDLHLRNTRKIYIWFYLLVIFIVGFYTYVRVGGGNFSKITIIVGSLLILAGIKFTEINRLRNLYTLTATSIIHREGLFRIKSKSIHIPVITDLVLDQGIWERIINYGSVEIFRFGEESAVTLKNINNPRRFIVELENRIEILGGGR